MNKIFKIIFNKRTNSFVVASELANSNGKASSTTDERKSTPCSMPSKFATLLVFSSAMLASQAFAGHTQIGAHSTGNDTTVSGNNAVAIGEGAVATGKDNAIAIGAKFHATSSNPTEGAQALGDNSIAIGQASKASTSQSIAIGQYAEIADTASQSITIGANTKVSGASSIAIGGDDAKGTDYHTWQYDDSVGQAVDKKSAKFDATSAEGNVALAIGIKTQAKADGSIALGVVSTAGGKESISIGAKSATKGTNAIALGTAASGISNNAIALGTDAMANLEGSVVLGANSTTEGSATQIKTTDKAEVGGYVYDGFAGTIDSDGDLVSIGNNTAGGQRKIINVAAGEITKQSTEAINGSQLYAVIDKINKANNGEAGPSVYTDPEGNRLVKANDGKYYPTNQVGADGQPLAGATAVDNPILSVVNPDGTTATPTAMGNIKSTVGLDSAAGKPIDAATAQTNVGNLLEAKDGLNNAATVGDLQALAQAGLDFTGNNNTDTVHRALGTKLAIEGEGSWDGANSAANNLYVQADPNNNKLVVKMNQALTGLTSVETKDANGNVAKLTPAGTEVTDAKGNSANYGANGLTVKDGNGNTTTIGAASTTVSNGTDTTTITPGAITGLKDLTDASDGSSAVNKNYVDSKLGNTVSSVGTGKDGRDGKDGLDGTGAAATGLTNADGLNGKSLTDKVNALRNGEAGPSVYTDPEGNRLVKANDGKYYPTNQVGADGQPLAGATAVDNPILSVVNPDGTTATPTAMGNIKSTVGLDSAAGKPIDAATAQTNVGNLLEAKDGLNNAATVGDLQALAQAGLDFTGNNNTDTVHRALGTKLAIEGEGSWDGANSAANNLYVQADPNNNKLVVKMNQALTGLTSVETKDANGNVAKLTPAGTEVTDAKGNSANYGANGLTVKDGNGNTTTIGAASTTVSNGTDTTTITPGAITGLKDLTDASDGSSAVNKNYVDSKLGNIGNTVGTGKDGRDGKDGLDGTGAAATGLTNADGLNGKSLTDKVNALRNGEAGPSVYTDPEGNRLVKANDGKYYPTNQVGADGQPLAGATAVDNPILSVVNPDGTTAKPTTMGNVKSTVGLDSAAGKPIDAATAQTNVGKLLEAKDGLNNAATVGDLQALAQAGLDFTGNNNTDTVHRALGTKLAIEGEGSWDGANSAANNLYVQADPNNNKLVVKMNQALSGLTSVETTDGNGNVAKLTPAGTEVTDANGNTANYGANGLTVKDANGNTAISLASTNGTSSLNFAMDSNGNGTGKITGIAPGNVSENSTDVVTGGQLYTLQNNVKNLATGLNNKLNNLNAKVNRNNRQLRGGIATVTAMTNIPQVTFAGKSAVGIGVGTYENEGAVSVGYSRMSDNGKVIMKISAGASTEDTFNAGAGVAFQW